MKGLLEQLHWYKQKDNRGFFANLRCYLVLAKRQKAWPALNRLNVAIDDELSGFIAAWYATHPEESSEGNFGTTCRLIGLSRKEGKNKDDDKVTPTERRFQQLLASEKSELPDRITRLILMAKAQNIPINYERLRNDISCWGEGIRTKWAQAFWIPNTETFMNEVAP